MRSELRSTASLQHGVFSWRQALTCYSPDEVRARIAAGRWARVHHGTYRSIAAVPSARLLVSSAALSIGRPVVACLHTAAELHGFGVLADDVTHVAISPRRPCARRPGLWPHQIALEPCDIVTLPSGIKATSPDRTVADLARTLPRIDVLAVLDAALAAGASTPTSVAAELTRHTGLRGVVQARELSPLACAGAESPQESRLRLRCHDTHLPLPAVQLPVRDADGRARCWLDLGWEEEQVGLDYDGCGGHTGPFALRRDRRRHNWLVDQGWEIFYAVDLDVYRESAELLGKVARALSRRSRASWGAA